MWNYQNTTANEEDIIYVAVEELRVRKDGDIAKIIGEQDTEVSLR